MYYMQQQCYSLCWSWKSVFLIWNYFTLWFLYLFLLHTESNCSKHSVNIVYRRCPKSYLILMVVLLEQAIVQMLCRSSAACMTCALGQTPAVVYVVGVSARPHCEVSTGTSPMNPTISISLHLCFVLLSCKLSSRLKKILCYEFIDPF